MQIRCKDVYSGRVKYIGRTCGNPAMKCGRMWSFYSWRHLVHDSQMGWEKLVKSLFFSFLGQGTPRWWRSCICDKLLQGVYTPWGESERCRAKNERATRGKGREGGREGETEREPCRNKLAVSCRGMEGETKMDTLMLSKSRRWVDAYSSPWPFSQHSSRWVYKPF